MPKVYNIKRNYPAGATYVGRPSKWGNPFVQGRDGTREEVIEKFRQWILASGKDVWELRGQDLVCFCYPLPCHADVLIELANAGEGER